MIFCFVLPFFVLFSIWYWNLSHAFSHHLCIYLMFMIHRQIWRVHSLLLSTCLSFRLLTFYNKYFIIWWSNFTKSVFLFWSNQYVYIFKESVWYDQYNKHSCVRVWVHVDCIVFNSCKSDLNYKIDHYIVKLNLEHEVSTNGFIQLAQICLNF